MDERAFKTIVQYLERVPGIQGTMAFGDNAGLWWLKFSLDIDHDLAWNVVQELAYVVNNLSSDEKLPLVFYPTSPPPYMNGGPHDFLSWVIETKDPEFKPGTLMKWLEGRLPNPVDDLDQWPTE